MTNDFHDGNTKQYDAPRASFLYRFHALRLPFGAEVFLLFWCVFLFAALAAIQPEFFDFAFHLIGKLPFGGLFLGPFFYGASIAIFSFSVLMFLLKLLKRHFREAFKIVLSLAIFAFFLFFSYSIFCLFITRIFGTVSPENVIAATTKIANVDRSLFQGYPAAVLQHWFSGSFFEWFFIFSYRKLTAVLSIAFVLLFFLKPKAFRALLLSFILGGFLCLPFWIYIPVITPQIMYQQKVFDTQELSPAKTALAGIPSSPYFRDNMKDLWREWFDPTGTYIAVSSFPSSHAAWGLFVVLALWSLSPILGGIASLWYAALLIGAVYLEQHFAVDMVAGVAFGFAIYKLVLWMLKKEELMLDDRYGTLYIYRLTEEMGGKIRRGFFGYRDETGKKEKI